MKEFLKDDVEVLMLRKRYLEIQSEDLEEIALESMKYLSKELKLPMMIEDSGLFIDCLNGFPGPYSSYIFEKIGNKGILKLMSGEENRRAKFVSVIAYWEPEIEVKIFKGQTQGTISEEERGEKGFGFDPIFIPSGQNKTFGEMDREEKNRFSHRGKALEQFKRWLNGKNAR